MDASGSHDSNRAYYDAFSEGYEAHRGDNDPGGYHELLDELETSFVERFGRGKTILEVGCGTGLVLTRLVRFAKSAQGIDLSPGMLKHAEARGLDVREGSATDIPFPDASFDVTCSFKVLSHVPDIHKALAEMARVTRPGGTVIAEFYNPHSFRALAKRYGPAGKIAHGTHESHVYTRYDSPRAIRRLVPSGCRIVASRGVRIAIPFARLMKLPVARRLFRLTEKALCDSPLKRFGGFYIVAMRKR